jgi:putative Holliday junction resolvase
MPNQTNNLLALDIGDRRIGVAYASAIARLASPLTVLANDESVWGTLAELIKTEQIGIIVVGLPRNLRGQDTTQTKLARAFGETLAEKCKLPIIFQDEALTSRQAEAELRNRGKQFSKGDIDALAATYILEDYLRSSASIVRMEEQQT